MSHQSLRQAVLPDAGGIEEKLRTQFVSGNAFAALGVTAAIGRVLAPSDDVTPGAHPVAVVSHAFWTRRLGGQSTRARAMDSARTAAVPDRRRGAGRIQRHPAGRANGHLAPEHDVPGRLVGRPELELAADLGTSRARRHRRRGAADRPDDAHEVRERSSAR